MSTKQAPQVLVVDDDKTTLELERALLEKAGAVVTALNDGVSAVSLATGMVKAGKPFDLIVLDIHMPGCSGIKTAREIRKAGFEGPMVAFTAVPTMQWKKEGKEAGINAYFNKTTLKLELITAILDQYCK